MGADIHAFIETVSKRDSYARCFAKVNLERNYEMFALMANVRNYNGLGGFEPKGLPSIVSSQTVSENCLWIVEDDRYQEDVSDTASINRSKAEKWVAEGASVWHLPNLMITHPDWHSHSWLSLEELESVYGAMEYPSSNLKACIEAIRALTNEYQDARLVFWFDN